MEVREFLQRMYAGRPGYAGISYQKTTRRSEDDLEGEKSGFLTRGFATSSIDTMVEAVAQLNAKHCDVWFSNATYATRPTHRKRGSARDVVSIAGLWADIDCSVGDHHSRHSLPPTLDDGHALIRAPRPTIVIETGGGLHSYWLFDQPWVFNAGDPAPAQLMEAWTGMLQRRAATYAWHVDSSVMDLARVLRVPETANYKMPYPRPVKVREYNTDATYDREYLTGLVDLARLPTPPEAQSGSVAWAYETLAVNGWTHITDDRWARPGKSDGVSAQVNDRGIYVYSDNADLARGWHTPQQVARFYKVELSTHVAAAWHDMSLVVNGELIRAEASIGWRADDVPMLYAGKEHSIYAETESGKTWMEALLTKQALERGMSVAVIDFEEGDQGEWGNRLLAMGLEGRLMTAESFRYATPSSADATLALVNDLLTYPPDLVIYEGVSSAFGLFGLKIEDNNSAVEYRARLIKPLLDNGVATLSSDHVTKSAEGRGRYAIGGVAKLNMVNGVAYTLEAYISIVKGQEGCSLIYVTKDRPGSVKPAGTATGVPGKTRFGSMIVRGGDLTDEPLDVFIAPPPDHVEDHELTLDDQVLRAVYALPDHTAASMTKLLAACRGAGIQRHNSALEAAVADLVHQGRMAEGVGRSNATTYTATIPSDEDLLDRL